MADSTVGQCFLSAWAVPSRTPLHTGDGADTVGFGARLFGSRVHQMGNGDVFGVTNSDELPVRRLVTVMTNPPNPEIIYETYSDPTTGAYAFPPWLSSGTYTVICTDPTGEHRTLAHNLVVPG
jgi:hypothetical protein